MLLEVGEQRSNSNKHGKYFKGEAAQNPLVALTNSLGFSLFFSRYKYRPQLVTFQLMVLNII
jgi:hypothetical protein